MTWYELRKLLTLIFGVIQKPLQIKESKMVRWWTTKEKKLLNIFGNILNAVPGIFRDFVQKNKFRVSEDFDNPLAKYIFSKEFLEGIDFISSYSTKSE